MRLSGSVKLRCVLGGGAALGGAGVLPLFFRPSPVQRDAITQALLQCLPQAVA
jgi:hypothetical protein